jgi:hypothetical protein
MKNSLVLLAVVLSVAAFAGMMRIKTDVQTMDRERMKLVNERAQLRETKRVLEAEWALLASPERMERLVRDKGYVPATALAVIPLVPVSSSVAPVVAVSASVVVSAAEVQVSTSLGTSTSVAVSGTTPVSATEREAPAQNDG